MTDRPTSPRVSVIIPAYKCARYLGETLDTVAAQTFQAWECIIVDDGSPDESAAIAQGYADRDPRFRLLRQANAGVAAARNAGYAAGHPASEFVIFQDSDDTWELAALSVLVAALDAHPAAAGAHGLAERMGPDGETLTDRHAQYMRDRNGFDGRRLVSIPLDHPTTLDCLVTKFRMFPPGVVLVRRPLIARAGLWALPSVLPYSEDWDLFARVGRFGPIVLVDRVIGGYRKMEAGRTVASERGHFLRRQVILRRLITDPETAPAQALLVRRAARAWGGSVAARQWPLFRDALRNRRWGIAIRTLRSGVFFTLSGLASDLDLRLHHLLVAFRRGRPVPAPMEQT